MDELQPTDEDDEGNGTQPGTSDANSAYNEVTVHACVESGKTFAHARYAKRHRLLVHDTAKPKRQRKVVTREPKEKLLHTCTICGKVGRIVDHLDDRVPMREAPAAIIVIQSHF